MVYRAENLYFAIEEYSEGRYNLRETVECCLSRDVEKYARAQKMAEKH